MIYENADVNITEGSQNRNGQAIYRGQTQTLSISNGFTPLEIGNNVLYLCIKERKGESILHWIDK